MYQSLLLDGPIEKDSKRFIVKLADFGLAKSQEMNQEKMTGLMGTYVKTQGRLILIFYSIGWHLKSLKTKIIQLKQTSTHLQ